MVQIINIIGNQYFWRGQSVLLVELIREDFREETKMKQSLDPVCPK